MKQIFTVLKFEVSQKLKEKSFFITILVLSLLIFGATFIPRFFGGSGEVEPINNIDEAQDIDSFENISKDKVVLFAEEGVDKSTIEKLVEFYEITFVNSPAEVRSSIDKEDEEFVKGIILHNELQATTVVKDQAFGDFDDKELSTILTRSYLENVVLKEENISVEAFDRASSIFAEVRLETVGKNAFFGYALSYVAIMFMYMTVIMNGQFAATNIAKEKDSRTMEILITNVTPSALIWGKVISSMITTIIQFASVLLAGIAGYLANKSYLGFVGELLQEAFGSVSPFDAIVLIAFMIIGLLMFYLLFAAFASLVNKLDELPQVISGVTLIIVIGFMVTMGSMSNPNSIIMKVASYVPFTSPLAIFPRMLMTSIPMYEVYISLGILVFTTIFVSIIAVKIYRFGTLNYGNKPNILKAIFYKN